MNAQWLLAARSYRQEEKSLSSLSFRVSSGARFVSIWLSFDRVKNFHSNSWRDRCISYRHVSKSIRFRAGDEPKHTHTLQYVPTNHTKPNSISTSLNSKIVDYVTCLVDWLKVKELNASASTQLAHRFTHQWYFYRVFRAFQARSLVWSIRKQKLMAMNLFILFFCFVDLFSIRRIRPDDGLGRLGDCGATYSDFSSLRLRIRY